MQIKNSLMAFVLGLGLTLALMLALSTVEGWLLGGGRLPVARAASFTVTKKSDGNDGACDADCSLREAIVAANSNGEADIITLGLGRFGLTITGTGENAAATGDLDVTGPLTITGRGPGQTIIDASGVISDRVFDVRPGAGTVVNIRTTGFSWLPAIRLSSIELIPLLFFISKNKTCCHGVARTF